MHESTFVADLATVLCVAAVTGLVARRLRQPPVLGYLLAGLIVGPYIPIPVFANRERVDALAEFGVVLVMFAIGLEFRIAKLVRVLPVGGLTALVQVAFLTWCGTELADAFGWGRIEGLFLGAGLGISSTMVVTKVFEDGAVADDVRAHVLGVLVLQDVIAVVMIAALTGVAEGEGLAPAELFALGGRLAGVLLGMVAVGLFVVPRLVRVVARMRSADVLAVVTTGLAFGLALLADRLGYSPALGAFIAGVLVAESGRGKRVEHALAPLRDVFAAVFFVSVGMAVDPRVALDHVGESGAVALVVVGGQLASVTVAGLVSGLGLRRSATAGLALGQIGEFAFILAAIGIEAGVARPELRSVLVSVAVLTAFTTPLALASAGRVVSALDRLLPRRVRQTLALYEPWLERVRASGADARAPKRRALRALGLDAGVLLALLACGAAARGDVAAWLSERHGFAEGRARAAFAVGLGLLCLPPLLGIARNAVALANLVGAEVCARQRADAPAARVAAETSRLMVALGVLLALSFPLGAALRPLLGGVWSALLPLAAGLYLLARLWLDAGAVAKEYRSGAELVADVLARQTSGDEAEADEAELLPGLDGVRPVPVEPGSHAVGRTLKELDLRARTGATVVAIERAGAKVLLPTGSERLEPGDRLALLGTPSAVDRAEELLGALQAQA